MRDSFLVISSQMIRLKRLIDLVEQIFHKQLIHPRFNKSQIGRLWTTYNWFASDIERGVDQQTASGLFL